MTATETASITTTPTRVPEFDEVNKYRQRRRELMQSKTALEARIVARRQDLPDPAELARRMAAGEEVNTTEDELETLVREHRVVTLALEELKPLEGKAVRAAQKQLEAEALPLARELEEEAVQAAEALLAIWKRQHELAMDLRRRGVPHTPRIGATRLPGLGVLEQYVSQRRRR